MRARRHTPGPWGINKYGSIGSGANNACPIIASVEPFYGVDRRWGDHSANARLIAAAPELAAFVEKVRAVIAPAVNGPAGDDYLNDGGHDAIAALANEAEAILTKVEGRST